MMKRRKLLLLGLVAIPAVATADDLIFGRRLRRRCEIPAYPYPRGQGSNPVSAGSFKAIVYARNGSLINGRGTSTETTDSPPPDTVLLKTFQMDQKTLTNDHCRLSQVAATISSEGEWVVHLLAEQNPEIVPAVERPRFEDFRRNLFLLELRPTGLMTLDPATTDSSVARPEFPGIPIQQFWINKEQSARIQRSGRSEALSRYFAVLEQMEFHFSYK
jgi:hypothetical protein